MYCKTYPWPFKIVVNFNSHVGNSKFLPESRQLNTRYPIWPKNFILVFQNGFWHILNLVFQISLFLTIQILCNFYLEATQFFPLICKVQPKVIYMGSCSLKLCFLTLFFWFFFAFWVQFLWNHEGFAFLKRF